MKSRVTTSKVVTNLGAAKVAKHENRRILTPASPHQLTCEEIEANDRRQALEENALIKRNNRKAVTALSRAMQAKPHQRLQAVLRVVKGHGALHALRVLEDTFGSQMFKSRQPRN